MLFSEGERNNARHPAQQSLVTPRGNDKLAVKEGKCGVFHKSREISFISQLTGIDFSISAMPP
jgi:hypothetical protein